MQQAVLIIGGVVNLVFVAFHASFWRFKRLDWRAELPRTNPVNRGAIQVMNLMLMYVFVAFAIVSFVMAATSVPRATLTSWCAVIGGFFVVRAVLQFVFFKPAPIGNVLFAVCLAAAACYFGALL